jgi:3-oxoacyl-[acyl-carrier-protein] synthase II
MFYIHQGNCISPQHTFSNINIDCLVEPVDNKLRVIEPAYDSFSRNVLRRMGKSVRIGVAAALPLIQDTENLSGIIVGTANSGMEESIHFLNQIIDFNEEMLAPGNFVQSTANSIASQIALLSHNKGYNITHVHRGLAFENAVLDAAMLLKDNPENIYLLGGIDEISSYNYQIDFLEGWYKSEKTSNKQLYQIKSPGSIAGEGSVIFIINNTRINALARVEALITLHGGNVEWVTNQFQSFVQNHQKDSELIDILLTGENGDCRQHQLYSSCEAVMENNVTIARFKHMCGEYPTATAFALWLACQIFKIQQLPDHMIKKRSLNKIFKNIIIYNNYKGLQHSFMKISMVDA